MLNPTSPLLSCILLASLSQEVAAASIEWNVDKRGRLKGTGCDTLGQDTFIVEAGEQLSIIFTRLNAELDAGDARKAESGCSGSIPIVVTGDRYLDHLEQTLGYSWSKSRGASARIVVKNRWYGRPLQPILVNIAPNQEGSQPFAEIATQDDLRWGCKPNDLRRGTLDLDFLVSAQRSQPGEQSVAVNLSGQDIRYTAETVWKVCPN